MSFSLPLAHRLGLILGLVAGVSLLTLVARSGAQRGPFEELALGTQNTSMFASADGVRVHCQDTQDLAVCLDGYSDRGEGRPVILWLGNSQLHAINSYAPGDETAALHLHLNLLEQGRYLLTLSQPNANLQEHYALFAWLLERLPITTLVLPLVFDDLRETGLRGTLTELLADPATGARLAETAIGRTLLANQGEQDAAGNDLAGLRETVQERSERFLNIQLSAVWPLWAERPTLRGELFFLLYRVRNWVFGIDPSSIRRLIPGRYALNRDALMALLELAGMRGIDILVYLVPLRNDVSNPYEPTQYAQFKADAADWTTTAGARFADLEDLVPPELWGAKASTRVGGGMELDFMHFQAGGHRLLADALAAELRALWGAGPAR